MRRKPTFYIFFRQSFFCWKCFFSSEFTGLSQFFRRFVGVLAEKLVELKFHIISEALVELIQIVTDVWAQTQSFEFLDFAELRTVIKTYFREPTKSFDQLDKPFWADDTAFR